MSQEGGEKKDQAGILRLKEWHDIKFRGFSFCLIYPGLGAVEVCNQDTPMSAD